MDSRPSRLHNTLARVRSFAMLAAVAVLAGTARLAEYTEHRWQRLRVDDTGSETTEKAVLTAIGLAVAVGLGAAITSVVQKYQGQIR